VIVTGLDRLFRSAADAAETIAEFDRLGIELVSIADSIDTADPE
jgi:DNA invertase Pin-like site-specific DNA recombinase